MSKILIIAEKPSVARDIGKVLNSVKKGIGYIEGEKYIITWAIGHLVTLYDPKDYDIQLKKWSRSMLPITPEEIKLKAIPRTRDQLSIIYKLIHKKEVGQIICATDSGREGELIFRYIYEISKTNKPFKRLWISSMTSTAIKKGFDNLKDGSHYDNLYYSAKCRSQADWLVGINATRAYTLKYNTLLSIGRVQTPTLNLLVERDIEIKNFKAEVYYEVISDYNEFTGKYIAKKFKKNKIVKKEDGEKILEECKGFDGIVKKVKEEEKKIKPHFLYDLTELQIDANKKYGYTAKNTLEIAQNLYEKRKLVTYPRTDSKFLSSDMKNNLKSIIKSVDVEPYCEYVKYLLSMKSIKISKRIINDSKITDHHAIIPTGKKPDISSLSSDEKKIFDLIVRRFLSVFFEDYKYSVTTATIEINENDFESRGIVVKNLGFNELYKLFKTKSNSKKEKEETKLPMLVEGNIIKVKNLKILEKKSKPPNHFTEAMLLSAMEKPARFVDDEKLKEALKQSGMGTPATRASIIERLIKVSYIERKGKKIIPTEKGHNIIKVVPSELKSPEITGKWERGLELINKGEMDTLRFMGSIKRFVNYVVLESNKDTGVIFKDENKFNKQRKGITKCPKCDGVILENKKAYFCSNWKNKCSISIWKNSLEKFGIKDIKINDNFIKEVIENKTVKMKKEDKIIIIKLKESLSGELIIENK